MECAATSSLMSIADHVAADIGDLDSILRLYRSKVFRFILASLRDTDAAETLTQDCFLKAYQARDRFRHECSLDTWLMQIAVNLVRDYSRNRRFQFWKRTQVLAKPVQGVQDWLSDGQRSPEASAVLKEEVQAIWSAAEHLPQKQRTVFLLRFVEDMDLLEIATATGMKEGTVKTHLFRALQAVRERVGGRA
ncbi:MAG: RNA polymerase sigma factor [Acidobacteriaceae bacterium]|nr:RNA polymerase sigma factor [Acidobacteriaceae bacterium]